MIDKEKLIVLFDVIELRCRDKLNVDILAKYVYMSNSHLQKIFKLLTGQALMDYVRGRKLACSLEDLLNTDLRIIDIANEYGFSHEQSYVRAFQKEYGCSPGKARKNKKILPIRERLSAESLKPVGQGLLYGPEIVMIPSFHVIGAPYVFENYDDEKDAWVPNQLGRDFYYSKSRELIPNQIRQEVYYGINTVLSENSRHIEYMPCIQVKNLKKIPKGMAGRTIQSHLCARFRYIGEHHYNEISTVTAEKTYTAIYLFFENEKRYVQDKKLFFERIDGNLYDGKFCVMEWFTPVTDTIK